LNLEGDIVVKTGVIGSAAGVVAFCIGSAEIFSKKPK